jgi:hypothetical protein
MLAKKIIQLQIWPSVAMVRQVEQELVFPRGMWLIAAKNRSSICLFQRD